MDEPIADTEPLANFVFDSDKLKANRVHWKAYMPGRDGERSLFRTVDLDLHQTAALAAPRIETERRPIIGWGSLEASVMKSDQMIEALRALAAELTLRVAEPPDRHAILDRWPAEKQQRIQLAQILANDAVAIDYPPTP